jgi:flavin-dependent dehydrogenase
MYDIAVIGLGPAGAFFVRHLSEKYRVIAIDKKAPPGESGFSKPCGGLLAPDAQRSLSRFNITLPKEILVSPQIFSVRTIDVKQNLIRHYQRHYINLDRHKFDLWLISKIPDHVEVHSDAVCTNITPQEEGYQVTYTQNGESRAIGAKYLVGADGAASIVRRTVYKDFKIRTHLSIQQWFADSHDTPFYSCVFDPDLTDSYAWGLTKDDCFIFGGAFSVKTGKQDFEALKKKLLPYGFQLDDPIKTEACLVLRPCGPRNYCYGEKNAFLIGESAGFISPSSLEGISYAVDSGYLLSQCFNRSTQSPYWQYRRGTRKIRMKLFLKYLKRPFMYHSFARKIIMKSGITSISVVE